MITLKTLTIKNFLSYGNTPTIIQLDTHKKTLIMGENGVGKSAIPQAICFVLFNKTYRNVNIPQLINSINEKECLIELLFEIEGNSYTVRRGLKPSLFEVEKNGVLISSERDFQKQFETTILKTNFNTFSSVIAIGGRNYRTFMNLKKSERRSIIESILDIDIFSLMNIVTKSFLLERQTTSNKLKQTNSLIEAELNLLKKIISDASRDLEQIKQNQEKTIGSLKQKVLSLEQTQDQIQTQIDQFISENASIEYYLKEFQTKSQQLTTILSSESSFNKKVKEREQFYHQNSSCPTCYQSIEEEFKNLKLLEIQQQRETKSLYFQEQEKILAELKLHLEELREKKRELEELKSKKMDLENEKKRVFSIIQELKDSFNQNINQTIDLVKYEQEYSDKKHSQETLKKELKTLSEEIIYLEFCQELLKDDGIKTLIIKEYLPIINRLINTYLEQLNLFINFTFDEFFSEEIKSRHRDIFSYESFSDGQKLKIDLALLFTWREISSLKNSLQMNILFLDEIFDSSLDLGNTELAIQTLNTFAKNNSVFIISHKTDLFSSSVERILSCSLINNFTQITEVV